MKNSLKIICVIIAGFVGAGFASGKEIFTFFYVYGIKGILGIVISSFLISVVIYKVLNICFEKKIQSYFHFCEHIVDNKKEFSIFLNNTVNIFLLISFFMMIAGFCSLLKQEFNINKIIAALIIIVLNYCVAIKNVNGLIKVSNYLIPFFIIFLIIISAQKINPNNISIISNQNIINNWLIKCILYASYNCIILIPIIVILSKKINNKKEIFEVSFGVFITIFLLSLLIFNLLLQGNESIYLYEIPIIPIVQKYGKVYQLIYILLIAISIFTTAVSSSVSFISNFKGKKTLLIISVCALMMSQISFGKLVQYLYPVLGFLGLVEIVIIMLKIPNTTCKKSEKLV